MNEELTKEILTRIDVVAEKLGTTAEYLWPYLVRAQFVYGLGHLIGVVIAIIACAFFSFFGYRFVVASMIENEDQLNPPPKFFAGSIFLAVSLMMAIVSFISGGIFLSVGIRRLLIPEAMVFMDIVGR